MAAEIVEPGFRYCGSVQSRWPDESLPEESPRFGRRFRLLALMVVIALILLTVVPVLIRVTRSESSTPSTTQPGVVAIEVGGSS